MYTWPISETMKLFLVQTLVLLCGSSGVGTIQQLDFYCPIKTVIVSPPNQSSKLEKLPSFFQRGDAKSANWRDLAGVIKTPQSKNCHSEQLSR